MMRFLPASLVFLAIAATQVAAVLQLRQAANVAEQQQQTSKWIQADDDTEGYEYGDRQSGATSDASDFSAHQFITRDDGRDGSDISRDGVSAKIARSKTL